MTIPRQEPAAGAPLRPVETLAKERHLLGRGFRAEQFAIGLSGRYNNTIAQGADGVVAEGLLGNGEALGEGQDVRCELFDDLLDSVQYLLDLTCIQVPLRDESAAVEVDVAQREEPVKAKQETLGIGVSGLVRGVQQSRGGDAAGVGVDEREDRQDGSVPPTDTIAGFSAPQASAGALVTDPLDVGEEILEVIRVGQVRVLG